MGWGCAYRVFYCSYLILRRKDVCLLRRQCLISYYVSADTTEFENLQLHIAYFCKEI